jgi:hypothetical protein
VPLPAGEGTVTHSVFRRASSGFTCWPAAKLGLSAASRPAAVTPALAKALRAGQEAAPVDAAVHVRVEEDQQFLVEP